MEEKDVCRERLRETAELLPVVEFFNCANMRAVAGMFASNRLAKLTDRVSARGKQFKRSNHSRMVCPT